MEQKEKLSQISAMIYDDNKAKQQRCLECELELRVWLTAVNDYWKLRPAFLRFFFFQKSWEIFHMSKHSSFGKSRKFNEKKC